MDCTYCVSQAESSSTDDELSTREWMEIIDQVTQKYGQSSIIVKGGEPMLRKDFFDLLEYIKSKGHFITLVTNGILIKTEETARRLERCVDQMEISLDGISAGTTDPIKGEGMFNRIMVGIGLVQNTRIKLGLSFVILEENQAILWDDLERFIKYRQGGTHMAVRIDNRISFPVGERMKTGDFFDFLRNTDKLACHGRLGRDATSGHLEVDASGLLHPYCPPSAPGCQPAQTL